LNSRGGVLVFYPADLQYKPEDIPRLVAPILEGSTDIVAGYKQGEYEKAFVSGVYNRLSRSLFKVPVRDLNSVKAYRREVMEAIPARPDWHRYMIVVAAAQGFTVSEVPVPLYPRHAGKSKFGIGRIPVGVIDMLAVWFELRFAKKAAASVRHAWGCAVHAWSNRRDHRARLPLREGRRPSCHLDRHSNLPHPRQRLFLHRLHR